MLHLVTGTPGQGKTLNTIKYVNEKKDYQGKAVYYHGIKGLNDSLGWTELSEDECYKWFKLPEGSIIIFDEAYTIFPVRNSAKKAPEHIERLARYRHKGFIIFLICQKVNGQLDPFIRGLINKHQHYARIMGSTNIYRFEWPVCQANPDSATARKQSDQTPLRLDKKYYDLYHSADEHNFKASLPKFQLGILAVLFVFTSFLGYVVYKRFTQDDEADLVAEGEAVQEVSSSSSSSLLSAAVSQPGGLVPSGFLELYRPEVDGVRWSAPIYRDQWYADSAPVPTGCHQIGELPCRCNSDQGTTVFVSEEECMHIIKHGFYDPRKPAVLEDQERFEDDVSSPVVVERDNSEF